MDLYLSEHSLDAENPVYVNGHRVGELDQADPQMYRFEVPAEILEGRPVAEVSWEVKTWRPSEHGMTDGRHLGAAVRWVEMHSTGAEDQPVASPAIRSALDTDLVAGECLRRVGEGATILLPTSVGQAADALGLAVLEVLEGRLGAGAPSVDWPDGGRDGVYWTETQDGYVVLNATDDAVTIRGVAIEPHGMAEVPG
jgi:hypothetical protein